MKPRDRDVMEPLEETGHSREKAGQGKSKSPLGLSAWSLATLLKAKQWGGTVSCRSCLQPTQPRGGVWL